MTFDDWWKEMKPAECDELKEHFVDCWQARDAEIAEVKILSDHSLRIYQETVELFRAEIATLREQVTLLEAEVERLDKGWHEANGIILEKSLAATEPKP